MALHRNPPEEQEEKHTLSIQQQKLLLLYRGIWINISLLAKDNNVKSRLSQSTGRMGEWKFARKFWFCRLYQQAAISTLVEVVSLFDQQIPTV